MSEQATYIKSLITPQAKKASTSRKVWLIDLETVWLPFFTATNTMGDTAIPHDALGAPLRLGYNKDGTVKFSQSGRPVIRVAKDLSDSVRMVRENFVAGLMAYANGVATENPEAYKAEIAKSHEAGIPIIDRDNAMLQDAYAKLMAEQMEAELKVKAKTEQPTESSTDWKTERKATPKPKSKARKAVKTHTDKPTDVPNKPTDKPTDIPANDDHATPDVIPEKEPIHAVQGEPIHVVQGEPAMVS